MRTGVLLVGQRWRRCWCCWHFACYRHGIWSNLSVDHGNIFPTPRVVSPDKKLVCILQFLWPFRAAPVWLWNDFLTRVSVSWSNFVLPNYSLTGLRQPKILWPSCRSCHNQAPDRYRRAHSPSPSSSSSSSVICQTTGPKPLPKRFLHIVRARASSFNWQYPLLSLRSSSNFLRLLPRLLVTSICPSPYNIHNRCSPHCYTFDGFILISFSFFPRSQFI